MARWFGRLEQVAGTWGFILDKRTCIALNIPGRLPGPSVMFESSRVDNDDRCAEYSSLASLAWLAWTTCRLV